MVQFCSNWAMRRNTLCPSLQLVLFIISHIRVADQKDLQCFRAVDKFIQFSIQRIEPSLFSLTNWMEVMYFYEDKCQLQ